MKKSDAAIEVSEATVLELRSKIRSKSIQEIHNALVASLVNSLPIGYDCDVHETLHTNGVWAFSVCLSVLPDNSRRYSDDDDDDRMALDTMTRVVLEYDRALQFRKDLEFHDPTVSLDIE